MDSSAMSGQLCDTTNEGVKAWLLRQTPSPVPRLATLCGFENPGAEISKLESSLCVQVKSLAEGHVGALGDTNRLEVWFDIDVNDDGTKKKSMVQNFIMKGVAKDRLGPSLQHGLIREVDLYKNVLATNVLEDDDGNTKHSTAEGIDSKLFQRLAPMVIACEADKKTGAKRVVLQDLSNEMYESGAIIGQKHTPLNFNKDVEAIIRSRYYPTNTSSEGQPVPVIPTQDEMVIEAFRVAARLHRSHWNQSKLLNHTWLRNSDLYKAAFDDSVPSRFGPTMQYLCNEWRNVIKPSMTAQDNGDLVDSNSGLCYTKRVVELLDISTSNERCSWDYYKGRNSSKSFTMIHGDFHPGNLMICTKTNKITMLDFEMVGVGVGPQDCAQLVMSHLPPKDFAHAADIALKAYYDELTTSGSSLEGRVDPSSYSFETCLQEYVDDGLGKWLWFLIILKNILPPPMISYFASQVDAFASHHNKDASNWMGTLHF